MIKSYLCLLADTKSFVAPNGSWFIQTTLDVFERHYRKMHVEEMFTIVNLVTSNKIAQERISKYELKDAIQMSCKHSTLRMKFKL